MDAAITTNAIVPKPVAAKSWWFTLLLGAAYPILFHLWLLLQRKGVVLSGSVAFLLLGALGIRALKQNYFLNSWDAIFHASVLLDIILEATLIPAHQGFGFYWCALGFGIVIGGYRFHLARRSWPPHED